MSGATNTARRLLQVGFTLIVLGLGLGLTVARDQAGFVVAGGVVLAALGLHRFGRQGSDEDG